MVKKSFGKEPISIQNIGFQRFWFGIIAGVMTTISLSLSFNYFREVFRSLSGFLSELIIFNTAEFQLYNYFFASLSCTLGLSFCIWIWMGNFKHFRKKDKIYKQLSMSNSMFIFWFVLWAIIRFSSTLFILFSGIPSYDDELNLDEEFWLLLVLLPLVIFFHNWFMVRMVYKAGKWMLFSFIACMFFSFLLVKTTTVSQETINTAYLKNFEKDYEYIDKEIANAKKEYGIQFKQETIDILKKWYTQKSINQVVNLKKAFAKNQPVSIDTIILQKIAIRNFKQGSLEFYNRYAIENWNYAYPEDVLKQIELTKSNSNKTKELFLLLEEQIDLVNTPEIEWDEYSLHTETEKRRSLGANYKIPNALISQLQTVRDSLIKVDEFKMFTKDLSEINEFNIK